MQRFIELKEFAQDNKGKIKLFLKFVAIAILFFGLGILVSQNISHAPIIIEKCADIR